VNRKQRATLRAIFSRPVQPDVRWRDIEALFRALGATINEGAGSRARVELKGEVAVFHRPHQPETDRGALVSVRRFLEQAGMKP
jgi:hypothetical protein